MKPIVHSTKIIYLLFSFEGKDYTVKAEFEIFKTTEIYFINVDQPALKSIVGDFFLIWRFPDGKFQYSEKGRPGSNVIKEAVVNSIRKLIE